MMELNKGNRILSMLIDYLIMSVVLTMLLAPVYFFQFRIEIQMICFISIFSIFLCKDSFGAQSFAKRTFKLRIIDQMSGKPASPIQTVIRNFTVIIWPIEVIMLFINPERRIGDYLAQTRIETYNQQDNRRHTDFKKVVVAYFCAVLFLMVLSSILMLPSIEKLMCIHNKMNML